MTIILTASGNYFDLGAPHDSEILITDIAHALSNICRFAGHCHQFYSVAQHSVMVSLMVPPEYALQALLHDASEAYVGDVTSPLKAMLPEYRVIERNVADAIYKRFNIMDPLHSPCIKHADLVALATERLHLLLETDRQWPCLEGVKPLNIQVLDCWNPEKAYLRFSQRCSEIMGKGVAQI